MKNKAFSPLVALVVVCLVGLVLSSLAWLINMELAFRVFMEDWRFVERIFPASWFALGKAFSADLSTISTFVPVLLFAFPVVQGWRTLRAVPRDPLFASRLESDPYPPHFAFFLVMLGLVGTLYGLMIGLDLSGVSDLAGAPLSQDGIRRSLDRLLGGTATALLSSLVGILGAFAAARPMAWLFRRAVGLAPDTLRRGLSDTVARLTVDMTALGEASRAFASLLSPAVAESFLARMEAQRVATEAVGREFARTNSLLERVAGALESNQKLSEAVDAMRGDVQTLVAETVADGKRLASLGEASQETNRRLSAMGESAQETNKRLGSLGETAQEANRLQTRHREDAAAWHASGMEAVGAVLGVASASRDCLEQDRDSRRKALAAYMADAAAGAKERS